MGHGQGGEPSELAPERAEDEGPAIILTDDGRVPAHEPVIFTDGGPWADHDCVCAVCRLNKAMLDLNTGIFQPCWACQRAGWGVTWRRPRRWRRKG